MPKLIVVGSGIKTISHITLEAKKVINSSEKCLYLVNEPTLKTWLNREGNNAESLDSFFDLTRERREVYESIANHIVGETLNHSVLCVVFYGHPAIFASSAINAIQKLRKMNVEAHMLPGISSIDVMWAELCIDPGVLGVSIYEASDFLLYKKAFDRASHLVLLQISVIGVRDFQSDSKIGVLQAYLISHYGEEHRVILFEAPIIPGTKARVEEVTLKSLSSVRLTKLSTLYIPPDRKPTPSESMFHQLA